MEFKEEDIFQTEFRSASRSNITDHLRGGLFLSSICRITLLLELFQNTHTFFNTDNNKAKVINNITSIIDDISINQWEQNVFFLVFSQITQYNL